MFAMNIKNFKKIKYHILKKKISLSVVYSKRGHKYEKTFREEESTDIKNSWFNQKYRRVSKNI